MSEYKTCDDCGALIHQDMMRRHADWHLSLMRGKFIFVRADDE